MGYRHAFLLLLLPGLIAFPAQSPAADWTATAPMPEGRFYHSATLLPDGKVLVAGGYNSNGYLSSASLYDPATESWSLTGSMSTPRRGHMAILLPNGKVLVAWGTGVSGYLSSAELYDPATGAWTAAGKPVAPARFVPTATLLANGKVLVAGGSAGVALASAEIYDPATGTWTATGAMAEARSDHAASLLPNGRVLVMGGNSSPYLSSAEEYDPVTGTWTATGSMTYGRRFHTATLLPDGKVLVAGGWYNSDFITATAELYDPMTGMWTMTGSMGTRRVAHTATLLPDGKVLAAGGGLNSSFLNSSELYDPVAGTWSARGSMTAARSQHTATLLSNGKVLAAGGYVVTASLSSAELYFVPDTAPPIVISTSPPPGSTGAWIDGPIVVTFNETMDPLSIVPGAFTLTDGVTDVTCTAGYAGGKATFTPASSLSLDTTYAATVKASVRDGAGNPMAGDYFWTFRTQGTLSPRVISTYPSNGQTNVSTNPWITVVFGQPMDPATIVPGAFVLTDGANAVPVTARFSGATATLTPSTTLGSNRTYTVTVKSTVKDMSGRSMDADYSWTFTTETIPPPTVAATSPGNGESWVSIATPIFVTFSQAMDPATIVPAAFTLTGGGSSIACTAGYSNRVATFTPTANLAINTTYTATVKTTVENTYGIPMAAEYSWTFTTQNFISPAVLFTNPASGATGFSISAPITVTFSKSMDPGTITSSAFVLESGGSFVTCSASYADSVATFTPASPLAENTTYVATLQSSVKDTEGNPLMGDYSWSFTTGRAAGPPLVFKNGIDFVKDTLGCAMVSPGSRETGADGAVNLLILAIPALALLLRKRR